VCIANIESADILDEGADGGIQIGRNASTGLSGAMRRRSLMLDTAATQAQKDDLNDDHALMR
jgi:hypothetical protein